MKAYLSEGKQVKRVLARRCMKNISSVVCIVHIFSRINGRKGASLETGRISPGHEEGSPGIPAALRMEQHLSGAC